MASIDITDQVSPLLKKLQEQLAPAQLYPEVGRAMVKLFREHFQSLPDNKHGWPTTNFWARAVKSTNYSLLADGISVNVNQQGVRQRLEGGEIHPVDKKYLAIPAREEAYGKRPHDIPNLELAFSRKGGSVHAFALVEAAFTEVSFGRQRKDGSRKVTPGKEHGGVMFWLVKSVHQHADPNVIPGDEEIGQTAYQTIHNIATRLGVN